MNTARVNCRLKTSVGYEIVNKINCIYKGEYLGNQADYLLHFNKNIKLWEVDPKEFFFDINTNKIQYHVNKPATSSDTKPPPSNPKVKGGMLRKHTRRIKHAYLFTRKYKK